MHKFLLAPLALLLLLHLNNFHLPEWASLYLLPFSGWLLPTLFAAAIPSCVILAPRSATIFSRRGTRAQLEASSFEIVRAVFFVSELSEKSNERTSEELPTWTEPKRLSLHCLLLRLSLVLKSPAQGGQTTLKQLNSNYCMHPSNFWFITWKMLPSCLLLFAIPKFVEAEK